MKINEQGHTIITFTERLLMYHVFAIYHNFNVQNSDEYDLYETVCDIAKVYMYQPSYVNEFFENLGIW